MLFVSFLILELALVVYIWIRNYNIKAKLDDDKGIKQVFYSQKSEILEVTGQEGWDIVSKNLWRDSELYLSIVVPAFNEEDRIIKTLSSMVYYMEGRSKKDPEFIYEIILVNDGGNDNTLRVCEDFWRQKMENKEIFGGRMRLISSFINKGKGNAVKLGVMASLGKYILMVDADGATKIDCFSEMEDTILSKDRQLQIVFGSRNMNSSYDNNDHINVSKIERAWYRQILNTAFHKITKVIINTDLNDTQCGFKLFSRESARAIFPSLHIKRWAFDIEIVIIAQILDLEIQPVSVEWKEVGGSKLSIFSDSIKMLLDILILKSFYLLKIWTVKNPKLIERPRKEPMSVYKKTI
ncbi:dolichyl phosphate glucosyltransferase [Cryptosporidium ubiquitum]|uniref:dolichyl-phosphate beta-glucosyltransferase n=1 Tax=Cryptosporidium ubiquitum TaxID=857276 RepID=A0A1J4MMK9_9CRYT|nr:dolichyl phosphate glucosyltransferase [Cryptosporidium ubiquitum]OII75424.1 dolichyl phosphate glucosyltransferase [Cryptosporidium ubiquitum]